MIHQLILNTLFACQPKTSPEIAEPTTILPSTPDIQPPSDKEETESPVITLVENLSEPKPSNPMERLHASPVQLLNIPAPENLSDEAFCETICRNIFSTGYQVLSNVEDCKLELLSTWKDEYTQITRQKDDNTLASKTVGNIECTAEIHRYMRGRAGLSSSQGEQVSKDLGGYFARLAQEEMTAVFAFQEMLQNLKSFNAPQKLLDDCEKAISDEKRHTIMMSNMAKRHGCESAVVKLPKQQKVSIFELAKHNAIAGCIEETWSALTAEYQSHQAKSYNKLFEIIAKDEIFHAQLSWDIHQWLMTKLSKKEQEEIKTLMMETLKQSPPVEPHSEKLLQAFGEMDSQTQQKTWKSFREKLKEQIEHLAA